VDSDGHAVVRDGIDTHRPGAFGPAVLGPTTRGLGSLYALGGRPPGAGDGLTRCDLAADGVLWRAVSDDVVALRSSLDARCADLRMRWPGPSGLVATR
jgi:hypothetical protein